jgi:hypothetical protein
MKKTTMNWDNVPEVYSFSCDEIHHSPNTHVKADTEHTIVQGCTAYIVRNQTTVRNIPMGFLYFSPAVNIKPMVGVSARVVVEQHTLVNIWKWFADLGGKERIAEIVYAFAHLVQGNYLLSLHNLLCSNYDSIGMTRTGSPRFRDFSGVPADQSYLSLEGCFYSFLVAQPETYVVMYSDISLLAARYFSARGEKASAADRCEKPLFECVGKTRDDAMQHMEGFREKMGLFSIASLFSNMITTLSIHDIPREILDVITNCMTHNAHDRPSSKYVMIILNRVRLR